MEEIDKRPCDRIYLNKTIKRASLQRLFIEQKTIAKRMKARFQEWLIARTIPLRKSLM